jgi:hypothetical protein
MVVGRCVVGAFDGFVNGGDLPLLFVGALVVPDGALVVTDGALVVTDGTLVVTDGALVVTDGALVVGLLPGNFVGNMFDGALDDGSAPILLNVGDFDCFIEGIFGVVGALVGFMPGIFVDVGDFIALGALLGPFFSAGGE